MKASLKRETNETTVKLSVDLDGSGRSEIDTGIHLLDEILCTIADASGFEIIAHAKGDLQTGDHHTSEDVAIAMGSVLSKLIKDGIGSSIVPAGECCALAAVRFGQAAYKGDFEFNAREMGGMALENFGHFCRSIAYNGRFTLFLSSKGADDRGKIIAMTTALGRALKRAAADGR